MSLPGRVYVAGSGSVEVRGLDQSGDRAGVRARAVEAAMEALPSMLRARP